MLVFVAFIQLVYVSASVPQISLVREWESVDVLVPGEGGQETSRRSLGLYDEEYSTVMYSWLLDVYKDRLFVALHYTRAPFDLNYHNLSDTSKSLLLQPYPSWDAVHTDKYGDRQIEDVVALRVDRCDRLWVIFLVDYDDEQHNIIVFDLNTDRILRQHTFWHFMNSDYHMAVDDDDCENPYLYIGNIRLSGIWTYSWAEDTIWHHPGDSVTGMVIAPNKSDYSIVYYNKEYSSAQVWYISTRYLRDKTSNMSEFEHRRGRDVYLYRAALDAKSNVLFASAFEKSIRAYPCWNRYEWCDPSGRHDIAVNTTHRVNHIILDKNGTLWAVTYGLTPEDNVLNFSIYSVAITSVTAELNKNETTNTTKLNETTTPATDSATSMTVPTTVETPNSGITATFPASSTTEQASDVNYDDISDIHYWDYWRYYMQWERRTTISPHRPSARR